MNKANATKEDAQGVSHGQTEGNQSGRIGVEHLSSGYLRIQGNGPCEWWQGMEWPTSVIDDGFFDEASREFRSAVVAVAPTEGGGE